MLMQFRDEKAEETKSVLASGLVLTYTIHVITGTMQELADVDEDVLFLSENARPEVL